MRLRRFGLLAGVLSLVDKIRMVTGGGEFAPRGPNPAAASYIASRRWC